jgi:tetratricopeptide (TPR) repeat protein
VARCHESAGAPAFAPWLQVARASVERTGKREISDAFGPLLPLLAPLLPEPSPSGRTDRGSLGMQEPQAVRYRLFDGMTRLLKLTGTAQTLVIAIDDLHRADPASLELLQFAIRELRDARIAIVGTYRDGELVKDSECAKALAMLAREPGARVFPLAELSVEDVAEYLARAEGEVAADSRLAAELHDRSGGNPFFLTQLVQLLSPAPGASSAGGALPVGIGAAITRQLEGLPGETRRALTAAAVIGREFRLSELAAAIELPIDESLAALAPAIERRLLVRVADHVRSYRFVHVLFRDALYEGIGAVEQCDLHRRVGAAIERCSGAELEQRAPELAHHFLEASKAGEAGPAIRYSTLAARRAAAQFAFEDACRHWRNAIELVESNDPRASVQRAELLLALGEAEIRAGRRAESRETLLRAANLSRAIPAPELLARVALGLAPGLFAFEVGTPDALLIGLLEEAEAALGNVHTPLRARVLARLAMALTYANDEKRRDVLSQMALAVAREVADPATMALALIARHGVLWAPEKIAERIDTIRELGDVANKAGDDTLLHLHQVLEINLLFCLGDIETVDRRIESLGAFARAHQNPHALWYSELYGAVRLAMQGRRAEAERASARYVELGGRVRDENAFQAFRAQSAQWTWEDGKGENIIPMVAGMAETYPTVPGWRAALAHTYVQCGRLEDARREFERIAANDFADVPWNEASAIAYALIADICARLADQPRAARLYEILLPARSHFITVGFASALWGSYARLLGLLAETLGRLDEAADHFEHAIAQSARVGAAPYLVQTQCDYIHLLLRRRRPRDRAKAEALVAEAIDAAERIRLPRMRETLKRFSQELRS